MILILFIIVLGVTIMIHEFGHFIVAKKNNVYVYEFSLGMGPKIFSKKKNETEYSIRLLPIGGFVSMAGEDLEVDDKIPKDRQLCNKSWLVRFATLIAGIFMNFVLAIVLLFIIGLINGVSLHGTTIASINEDYPIHETNLRVSDEIIKVNDTKIDSYDTLVLELAVLKGADATLTVKHQDGEIEKIKVSSIEELKDSKKGFSYGFSIDNSKEHGFLLSIKYAFSKTKTLVTQMYKILYYLVTGKLGLDNLAGPIGIYSIVGDAAKSGILSILYLIAYLCINVAVINLLPFPAFDGGRILFLIIEKIKGSRVNPKVENIIHSIGFALLMVLMIYVSIQDILRLFK